MSDSKIQIKVGHVEFSGEGNQDWVAAQLDKILAKVPELLKIEMANPIVAEAMAKENAPAGIKMTSNGKPANLATFLKEKDANVKQVRKFLATAAFIQLNGKERLTTADIATSLSKNSQSKINNPADNLNSNVGKGFCNKDGDGNSFYVTPEGFKEIGIEV